MTGLRACAIVLLFTAGLAAAVPAASRAREAPVLLGAARPAAPADRAVVVVLAGGGIDAQVFVSPQATAATGGLLGALIISAMDDGMRRLTAAQGARAATLLAPIARAAGTLDLPGMARASAEAGLVRAGWGSARPALVLTDARPEARATALGKALGQTPAAQVATLVFQPAFSPDFTRLSVILDLEVTKPGAKPGAAARVLFRQRIGSIVQLRHRSYEAAENAAAWSAMDGARAKAALALAFARLEQAIPRALALTPANIAGFAAKGREKAYAGDVFGTVIAREGDDPEVLLLWAGWLVSVVPAPEVLDGPAR